VQTAFSRQVTTVKVEVTDGSTDDITCYRTGQRDWRMTPATICRTYHSAPSVKELMSAKSRKRLMGDNALSKISVAREIHW
jgi:hypothetical protein